jgi:hypothetical protein
MGWDNPSKIDELIFFKMVKLHHQPAVIGYLAMCFLGPGKQFSRKQPFPIRSAQNWFLEIRTP